MTNDSKPIQFDLSLDSDVAPLTSDSGADAFETNSKTTNRPGTEDGGTASELPSVVVKPEHESADSSSFRVEYFDEPADAASIFREMFQESSDSNCDPDCEKILVAMMEVFDAFADEGLSFLEKEIR